MTFEHVSIRLSIELELTAARQAPRAVRPRPRHARDPQPTTRRRLRSPDRADWQTPLSRLPGATPTELTAALTKFSSFLTSHDPLTSPRLALLANPRSAEAIHRTALRRIAEAYAEVCERVLDKKEGYEFAETLLRRGRDEVEVALGVAS